jgi:glycosyltransferase involved in cell wall biosynthesis
MISVVTPNYNGEKYLPDYLNSLRDQTLDQERFEVLFVDDGSTDQSRDLVDSYKDAIPNLRPVWNEHIGKPGELRNIAIQRAMGHYILFLDSDDYLGVEALERLDDFSSECPSDLTLFQIEGLNRDVMKFTKTEPHTDLIESGAYKTRGIWKMVATSIIQDYGIRFSDVSRGDDVLFMTNVMLKARTTSILADYAFYMLRGREEGTSITQKPWPAFDRATLAREMALMIDGDTIADPKVKNFLMLRAFNTDSIAILNDPNITEQERRYLREALEEFWNDEVQDIFYNDENLRRLRLFFGEKTRGSSI